MKRLFALLAIIFSITAHAVNVDDFKKPTDTDDTNAVNFAQAFQRVDFSNRTYIFNGEFSVRTGQVVNLNGATLTHTDNTKRFFAAINVDGWAINGPGTLTGLLSSSCGSSCPGEKGIYVEAARDCRVRDVEATLFLGPAFHVNPGSRGASPFLGDTCQWSNIHGNQSMVGFQVDAGTAAEYQTITNLNAIGNITGVQIAGGNVIINGCNIVENYTNGLYLMSGSNNGHGIISGCNINHNGGAGGYNLVADGVNYGFTLNGVHLYANSATSNYIWIKGATSGLAILNSVIDGPVTHDASGTNRIINTQTAGGTFFSVGGANLSGLVQVGNF